MRTNIKTKLTVGLMVLFAVILAFGGLGIFYVKRLSSDAGMILKDNHISLEYCNHMLKALDDLPDDLSKEEVFESNLKLEENNITEPGEYEATAEVRGLFEQLKKDPRGFREYKRMRRAILTIEDVNQVAIVHKNIVAARTAIQATFWLTVIVTVLTVAALAFILNFPSMIARPVKILTEGIKEIAGKNYSKRIDLKRHDEFGELADAFNSMAEKLDEYEHSNLAELTFEKNRVEAIINKMNDGIIVLSDKQHILFFNTTAEKLFELRGKNVVGRYAPDVALDNDLLRALLQKDSRKTFRIFADNKECFFAKESVPIQSEDGAGGQVILLRNVTPFQEQDAAKTNFIATISHELKTPLFALKVGTQLLDDRRLGDLNADQTEILGTIKGNTERLLKITAELLNMSQMETGKMQIKLESTDPVAIVLSAIKAITLEANQTGLQLCPDIETELPAVKMDAEKVSWVLINLLSNAVKYSNKGGQIEVKVRRGEGKVEFQIVDHGRGIEEKYLPHIFEKYFKVPGTDEKTGTGLGLAISKEFIEALGGTIWVRSTPGKGSTFGFTLMSEPRPEPVNLLT
ncbi:MAG TPA: ATP-binding protein [Puia sp.]|uniref:sensor histidine kinase n=1 Tax=Puia sp. TaxID=2045100 RepID=UPI002B89EFF9|nr:ATP-binding protein [Puia sp.]HVU97064.1 ATP-binding protein [Puia sp.]